MANALALTVQLPLTIVHGAVLFMETYVYNVRENNCVEAFNKKFSGNIIPISLWTTIFRFTMIDEQVCHIGSDLGTLEIISQSSTEMINTSLPYR